MNQEEEPRGAESKGRILRWEGAEWPSGRGGEWPDGRKPGVDRDFLLRWDGIGSHFPKKWAKRD